MSALIRFFISCWDLFYSGSPTFCFESYAYVLAGGDPLKEILSIFVFLIGLMVSKCVLFYPQETVQQKAVKIGCHMGTIAAFIFAFETIQKFFS